MDIYTSTVPEAAFALESRDVTIQERAAPAKPADAKSNGESNLNSAVFQSVEARGLLPSVCRLSASLLRDHEGRFFVKTSTDRAIGIHELRASAIVACAGQRMGLPPAVAAPVDYDVHTTECVMYYQGIGVALDEWLYSEGGEGRKLMQTDAGRFAKAVDGIVTQVVVALHLLQKHIGYHHNDLHSRNVCVCRPPHGAWSVSFDLDGETRCYSFSEDVPVVRFADHEFAVVGDVATCDIPECSLRPLLLSNLVNNCFDLWRFCTSTFLRRRSVTVADFNMLSTSLQIFLDSFRLIKHYDQSRDWFPFLSTGVTPTDCARARWDFMEQFRSSTAARRHYSCDGEWARAFQTKERRSSAAPVGAQLPLPNLDQSVETAAFVSEVAKRLAKTANARVNAKSATRRAFALGDSTFAHKIRFLKHEIIRAQRLCRALFYVAGSDVALTKKICSELEDAVDYSRAHEGLIPLRQVLCPVPAERTPLSSYTKMSIDVLCNLIFDARRREIYCQTDLVKCDGARLV